MLNDASGFEKVYIKVPMNEPAAIIHYMQKVENKKQQDML
ncbi:unknown [Clostridium sp. CAG:590]|nr:unknown [Clostridium sp. CAG:590]